MRPGTGASWMLGSGRRSGKFGLLLERIGFGNSFYLSDGAESGVAEELAQEVFLRVYRSRGTYEPTRSLRHGCFASRSHLGLNGFAMGGR